MESQLTPRHWIYHVPFRLALLSNVAVYPASLLFADGVWEIERYPHFSFAEAMVCIAVSHVGMLAVFATLSRDYGLVRWPLVLVLALAVNLGHAISRNALASGSA
jgi:hypothetical protein